ncbi:726_t:CDS:1, partial [Entrophospora sp. SA101]
DGSEISSENELNDEIWHYGAFENDFNLQYLAESESSKRPIIF